MAGCQDNTLRIVLVGKTGSGKSATANTILGVRAFDSKISATSVTKSCQYASRAWKGRKLLVVDTPGLFDTKEKQKATCEEIARCVMHSSPGPHAFILVVRLSRFTEEEQKTVELIKAIFGEQFMKYMIVLFTGKDDLEGQDLSVFIANSDKCLKTIIAECELRYCAFNNKSADKAEKEAQVQELVGLIEALVWKNGGAHFSDAMYEDTAEKQKVVKETVEKIRADQLENEKWLDQKYDRNEITKEEMEERRKVLQERYDKQVEKTKEEGEKSILTGLLNKISSVISAIWHKFWD